MSLIDNNLKKLNIILPDPKGPVGAYVATKIVGKLLFISGQVSIDKSAKLITGKIGKDLNLEQGYMAAERCGLSIIAQVKKACDNDLSKVKNNMKNISGQVFVNQNLIYTVL